jgi:hypothetical protein
MKIRSMLINRYTGPVLLLAAVPVVGVDCTSKPDPQEAVGQALVQKVMGSGPSSSSSATGAGGMSSTSSVGTGALGGAGGSCSGGSAGGGGGGGGGDIEIEAPDSVTCDTVDAYFQEQLIAAGVCPQDVSGLTFSAACQDEATAACGYYGESGSACNLSDTQTASALTALGFLSCTCGYNDFLKVCILKTRRIECCAGIGIVSKGKGGSVGLHCKY